MNYRSHNQIFSSVFPMLSVPITSRKKTSASILSKNTRDQTHLSQTDSKHTNQTHLSSPLYLPQYLLSLLHHEHEKRVLHGGLDPNLVVFQKILDVLFDEFVHDVALQALRGRGSSARGTTAGVHGRGVTTTTVHQ